MSTDQKNSGALKVAYLGISGVLHPSASTFEMVYGSSPWTRGHHEYEAVPLLFQALLPYPAARIVLTSTQPKYCGVASVLSALGAGLASRVMGWTFDDLTTKVRRGRQHLPVSVEDYWRMNKSEIVRTHREWLKPAAWVAIDDDGILWDDGEQAHVVETDGCAGLVDQGAFERLKTVLAANF